MTTTCIFALLILWVEIDYGQSIVIELHTLFQIGNDSTSISRMTPNTTAPFQCTDCAHNSVRETYTNLCKLDSMSYSEGSTRFNAHQTADSVCAHSQTDTYRSAIWTESPFLSPMPINNEHDCDHTNYTLFLVSMFHLFIVFLFQRHIGTKYCFYYVLFCLAIHPVVGDITVTRIGTWVDGNGTPATVTFTLWFNSGIYQCSFIPNTLNSENTCDSPTMIGRDCSSDTKLLIDVDHADALHAGSFFFETTEGSTVTRYESSSFCVRDGASLSLVEAYSGQYQTNTTCQGGWGHIFTAVCIGTTYCVPHKQLIYFDTSRPGQVIHDALWEDGTSVSTLSCNPTVATTDPTSTPTAAPSDPTPSPTRHMSSQSFKYEFGLHTLFQIGNDSTSISRMTPNTTAPFQCTDCAHNSVRETYTNLCKLDSMSYSEGSTRFNAHQTADSVCAHSQTDTYRSAIWTESPFLSPMPINNEHDCDHTNYTLFLVSMFHLFIVFLFQRHIGTKYCFYYVLFCLAIHPVVGDITVTRIGTW
eukprot:893904_1